MPTDRNIPQPLESASDTVVDDLEPAGARHLPDSAAAGTQPDGEMLLRGWEGLPQDAVFLVPPFRPTPMRTPDHAWALRVDAVDLIGEDDDDCPGAVDVFAGSWTAETPASGMYDGDLVVRLMAPTTSGGGDDVVDAEMLLAHHGRWQCVGRWRGVDCSWPHLVAATAKAVMDLHTDLVEAKVVCDGIGYMASPPSDRFTGDGLVGLLKAGLVSSGDEFVWDCRQGNVSYMVQVRPDGALEVADGGVCASPTVAATLLGGTNRDGWTAFTRVSDGRTLADLRAEAYQLLAD